MTTIEEADSWIGRTAVDNTGEQIGIITQIWVDDASGQPEWASVTGTAIRGREALVPLTGTAPCGSGRRFAFSKEEIVDAPQGARDGRLEVADKELLASYYGAPDTDSGPEAATWVDRAEDAADGGTVRDISALSANGAPGPAAQAPAAKAGRRFGRKTATFEPSGKRGLRRDAAPSKPSGKRRLRRDAATSEPSGKRRFRRNASPSDQQPAELAEQPDEVGFRH